MSQTASTILKNSKRGRKPSQGKAQRTSVIDRTNMEAMEKFAKDLFRFEEVDALNINQGLKEYN